MAERFYEPGDTLWFCGTGWESRCIALWTTSLSQKWRGELLSHVGIIAEGFGRKPVLFESTTLNDKACAVQHLVVDGVQAHYPDERIRDYGGRVYLGRLRVRLTEQQSKDLTVYLADMLGTPYDLPSALLAGTSLIKRLFRPDDKMLFCDELTSFAEMHIGVIPPDAYNPSAVTPAWVARWKVKHEIMQPLRRVK